MKRDGHLGEEMNKDFFNPNLQLNLLKNERNLAGRQMYYMDGHEEVKVEIYPDKSVSPSMFVPNKTLPGTYRAHPTTIRAMRKDLFANMHSEAFEELQYDYKCEGCSHIIDLQFWEFCPHCEKSFPKELPPKLNC